MVTECSEEVLPHHIGLTMFRNLEVFLSHFLYYLIALQ